MEKLPSHFQPGDKVGLETLIDFMYKAKDATVVSVSFGNKTEKYNLSIPQFDNNDKPDGFFRLANVDEHLVNHPFSNEFHYNSKVAIMARESAQAERIRNENKEAFKPVDKVFDIYYPSTEFPKEAEENCGYSDDVLIDRTGKRKNFVVGWYDHEDKKWIVAHGTDELEPSDIVWQYLPLAKYDKK